MSQFGPLDRAILHRQIRVAVREGKLAADALALYPRNADFAQTLEEALGGTYQDALAASPGGGAFASLFQWLLQNLPKIIEIVTALISAFGGGTGPTPAPAALKLSAECVDNSYAAHGECLGFSLPSGTGALIAEIVQAVLPIIEQAVEAAVKKYLPTKA